MSNVNVSNKESAKNYIVEYEDFKKENLYTNEEREAIRQKVISDGFVEPIIIWSSKNILVWGYEELAIAKELNLPYSTKEIEFESEIDCMAWIWERKLAVPSLSSFQKTEVGLKFWQYWRGKDEAKYGAKSPLKKAAKERYGRSDKSTIVAIKAGISHNTVNKICRILESEDKKLIEDCRCGVTSISAGYNLINGDGKAEDDDSDSQSSADDKKTMRRKKQKRKEVDSLAKYCSEGFSSTKEKLDEHALKFFILRWNEEHQSNPIDNKDVKKAIKLIEKKEK